MARLIRIAPSPSIFGFGALASLPEELRLRKLKKILVITDPQIAAGGILEQVLNPLKADFELEQFQEAPTEPHSKDIDAQKERFGEDFDALLAVGGGSAMDFAKALAILMTHGGVSCRLCGGRIGAGARYSGGLCSDDIGDGIPKHPDHGFYDRGGQNGLLLRVYPARFFRGGPGADPGTAARDYPQLRL